MFFEAFQILPQPSEHAVNICKDFILFYKFKIIMYYILKVSSSFDVVLVGIVVDVLIVQIM